MLSPDGTRVYTVGRLDPCGDAPTYVLTLDLQTGVLTHAPNDVDVTCMPVGVTDDLQVVALCQADSYVSTVELLDPVTGLSTTVGQAGEGGMFPDGAAYDRKTHVLYTVASKGSGPTFLAGLNLDTLETSHVPFDANMYGSHFGGMTASGDLIAATAKDSSHWNLSSISPVTGIQTPLGPLPGLPDWNPLVVDATAGRVYAVGHSTTSTGFSCLTFDLATGKSTAVAVKHNYVFALP